MRKNSKTTVLRRMTTVIGVALVATILLSCEQPEERNIMFFYEAVCPSCEDSQRMEDIAGRVAGLGRTVPNTEAQAYDIYHSDGISILEEAAAEADRDLTSIGFPVLIVNGEIYEGEETIVAKIEEIRAQAKR